jgi:hypothetical protein
MPTWQLQSGTALSHHRPSLFLPKKHFVWLVNYRFRLGEISEIDGSPDRALQGLSSGSFLSNRPALQMSKQTHPGEKLPEWPGAAGETLNEFAEISALRAALKKRMNSSATPAVAQSSKVANVQKNTCMIATYRDGSKRCSATVGC